MVIESMAEEGLEKLIGGLVEKYGYIKVNLAREEGGENEGVWAVLVNDISYNRYKNETSYDEEITVRLCNHPIGGWFGKNWGDEITALTRGDLRPTAFAHLQR